MRGQFKDLQAAGYGHLPICMAKTQYSFTTDPNARGAPTGHTLPIREVILAAGAEFVVVVGGERLAVMLLATWELMDWLEERRVEPTSLRKRWFIEDMET